VDEPVLPENNSELAVECFDEDEEDTPVTNDQFHTPMVTAVPQTPQSLARLAMQQEISTPSLESFGLSKTSLVLLGQLDGTHTPSRCSISSIAPETPELTLTSRKYDNLIYSTID
jgi:hypothetical protein